MEHFNDFIKNPYWIFYSVISISSIGVILSAFEWLSLRKHFTNSGIFSWEVRSISLHPNLYKSLINFIFKYPNINIIYCIQIIVAVLIFFTTSMPIFLATCCSIIAIISILLNFRTKEGISGADKMTRLVMITGAICFLKATPLIINAGLTFISLQLILAYTTAGWVRLFVQTWRNGTDLGLILRQHTYSNEFIWAFTKNNKFILKVTALFILFFECTFFICILLPSPFFYLYIALGVIFHIGNAIIMGLNTFVWSFLSTYPALIWLHHYLDIYK